MAYFIVTIHYVKPMEVVEQHTPDHRAYAATLKDKGVLLASGPFKPRTGGLLLMKAHTRESIEDIIKSDPFHQNEVAEYLIREWVPTVGAELFD